MNSSAGNHAPQSTNEVVRYAEKMEKFKPKEGQAIGPTGAQIPTQVCTAMSEAVKTGDVDHFLNEASSIDFEIRDVIDVGQFKQNLVFSAITIQDEDKAIAMIKALVEKGVDLLARDTLNQTPLYYASRDGKTKLIQVLVEQGMNINNVDIYGQNPIYYAVNLGHLDACKLLKAYGSNHDLVDENGQTPIYYAIKSNREDVLRYLLEIGCDLSLVDNRGYSPINFAMRHNRGHFKEMLLKYGAPPPNSKTKKPKPDKKPPAIPPQPK